MKSKLPPTWLCVLALVLALGWRVLGAPITAQDVQNLKTPMWQAGVLLPQRIARIWMLWLGGASARAEQETLTVYLAQENRCVSMTLEGYVCGVVAAEMPAQYHREALKAQAVAARTRVLKQMESGGCSQHPEANICTDSAHCQGYASMAACQERWGNEFEVYRDRILQAVHETEGQVIAYEGELITVLYHAMSGGRTEDAQTVFAQSLPYLVSVESEGEESARGFWQETTIGYEELAEKLKELADATPAQLRQSFAIGAYTESGRVRTVLIGDAVIDATDFRQALGLRSTWFSITADEAGITFLQRGYGHGVGMSQVGANSMAANGADHAAILAHYYPGTTLESR